MRKRFGIWLLAAIVAAAGVLTAGEAWAQADRYAKYKGTSILVNVPAHPHYDAALKLFPDFTRETGIKVEVDRLDYLRMKDKQLLEMSKPRGDYDVITYVVMWKTEYVKKDLLEALQPYFDNKALADPAYDMADIIPGYLENLGLVGGKKGYLPGPGAKLYGIPYGSETSIFAYRKDIFEKHGLKPPTTYDEMLALARTIKQKEPGMGGLTSRGQAGHQVVHAWLLHLNPLGGEVFDDNWNPVFQKEIGVKALKTLKEISETGPQGIPGFGYGEMLNSFLMGQAAMYLDNIALFGVAQDPEKSKIVGKVGYALHPKALKYSSQTGGFGISIPRNAKNKEAAFLFVQWLTSKAQDKKVAMLGGNAHRNSTLDDPALRQKYPEYAVLKEQLKYANPDWRPIIPEWDELNVQVLGVGLSEALIGKKTPEEALSGMVPKATEIMKRAGYIK